MTADKLLERVSAVKRTGPDRWLALCPAHDDVHPSLSIREMDDGKVLVKCWASCSVEDVLAAVGLEFDALFPPRPTHHCKPTRKPWPANDVLHAIEREALITAIATSRLANGQALSREDCARLMLASRRITAAVWESQHA